LDRSPSQVEPEDAYEAIVRVIEGPERKSHHRSVEEQRLVAYYEAAKALVASRLTDADPVFRVSIVPTFTGEGHTRQIPEQERTLRTRGQLKARLAVLLAGRAAEELLFHEVSTAATVDIQEATRLAIQMITQWGMSDVVGLRTVKVAHALSLMGAGTTAGSGHGRKLLTQVDQEVTAMVAHAQGTATSILEADDSLHKIARELLARETLYDADLHKLVA